MTDTQKELKEMRATVSRLMDERDEAENAPVEDEDADTAVLKLDSKIRRAQKRIKKLETIEKEEEVTAAQAERAKFAASIAKLADQRDTHRETVQTTLVDWYGPDHAKRIMFPGAAGQKMDVHVNDAVRRTILEDEMTAQIGALTREHDRVGSRIKELETCINQN